MRKKSFLILILCVFGTFLMMLLVSLILNPILENKIKTAIIKELPENSTANDFKVSVNSLKGSATLQNLHITLLHSDTISKNSEIHLKKASLSGLSYLKYLFSDQISFQNIQFNGLDLKLYQDTLKTKKNAKARKDFPGNLTIANFQIENSSILLKKIDTSFWLQANNLYFSLKDVFINDAVLREKIPFQFSEARLESKDIKYQLNKYDLLSAKAFSLKNSKLNIDSLVIQTMYSKTELSKILTKERDHTNLLIPSLTLNNLSFQAADTSFLVRSTAMVLENPELNIYRDKMVAENTSIKPLYSKSLRELPFYLNLDSLFINNAFLVYEEKVSAKDPVGKISFSKLNASIANVSNTYHLGEKKTTLHITSHFMDNSPLKIDWSFDTNDLEDRFYFQGELGKLEAKQLNSFTKSSLNINFDGTLKKTFFNIQGNDFNAQIDLRLSYSDLKIEILDKKNKKNLLLSSIANIFVKKNSASKESDFIEGKATANRNRSKSFFNYLWVNIQEGLKETMIPL